MRLKSFVFVMILVSLISANVFAHGKKDVEEQSVDNLNSWQETFDLEGKKKGKFNVMVKASDLGGNEYVEGPFNLWVDPESDLCIPGITNPYPNMRVVGNLNIVGTCVDDDAVDYVELVFDGNDGLPIRAQGKEFWSYYLDTTELEEGPHTITVTGYDINGLKGKTTSVTWQLDRRQPLTAVKEKDMVTDKAMGELVSGNVHFIGTIEDGNGIKELRYSIDNGEHFYPLKIKINDKLKNAEFDIPINTTNFPDGPAVLWFKAMDNAGSVGVYSYLYFIDNTKPDVKIISPTKDEVVNGKFSIAGYAKDQIGISELVWTFGSETGTIDLVPGNPYWCLNFDTIGSKDKSRKFSIKATDIAKNVVEVSMNVNIDQEKDKPVVTITDPAPGGQFLSGEQVFVRGFVTDDDHVQSVKISVDGKEPILQETKSTFCYELGDAADYAMGKHKITVIATDINGVEGNPVTVEFVSNGAAPQFSEPKITSGRTAPTPFVNGIEIHPEGGSSFNIDILSTSGLKNVQTQYLCGDFEPIETNYDLKSVTKFTATIPIAQSRPYGVVTVKITATDIYDRVSTFAGVLHVSNTAEIKNVTPAVVFDDSIVDEEGRIVLNSEFPASGYLVGETASRVDLVPATPLVNAKLEGNQIVITPGSSTGISGKTVVRVTTTKGNRIESEPLIFVNDRDAEGPFAHFASVNGADYRSGMPVVLPYGNAGAGSVVAYIDAPAVNSVSYEITGDDVPGGDIRQVGSAKLTKPAAGETRWTAEIPLKNLPARVTKIKLNIKAGGVETPLVGTVTVVRPSDAIRADDKAKIYTVPSGDIIYNSSLNQYFMGKTSQINYYANIPSPISAELLGAGTGLTITTTDKTIVLTPTAEGTYSGVRVRARDVLGNVYESQSMNLVVDSSAPDIKIVTPEPNVWVGKTINLSGTVADASGVAKLEYSIDKGETWNNIPVQGGSTGGRGITFSRSIDVSSFEDGIVGIDIRASDYSGHTIIKHIAVFKDITPPEVSVILPLDSDIVNGETLIVFKASDNGDFAKTNYIVPPRRGNAKTEIPEGPLISTFVGTAQNPIDDTMSFEFIDDAGNRTRLEGWKFLIDNESDLPIAEIHVPEDNQVITRDFTISGIVRDDDGDSDIYWKIDNRPYQHYPEMGTSFSVDIPLSEMTDNEHTVTVYAVDVNGVKGPETVRRFRVSLEEPKGAVVEPKIDVSVRELITISGWATDKNGIGKVQVSLDNGNSYNDAVITRSTSESADWSYTVDTRAIPGGTQVVFLKITDKYDIQGLYSSLINIDNENPVLGLDYPIDDSTTTGMLFFSGYAYDNVEITDMYVTIRSMEGGTNPFVTKFPIDRVIGKTLDIKQLRNGFYNVELTAKDKAGNTTNVSRNIHLDKNRPQATVDLLYPLNGEHKTGEFNIYGQAESEVTIETLKLYVDKKYLTETTLTHSGFYKFEISQDMISEGEHSYYVEAVLDTGATVQSRAQTLVYTANGPWVTIDNFTYGDFAVKRPYIMGRAGYSINEDELLFAKTKEASQEAKDAVAAKSVAKIELSFDNGKTFIPLSKGDKWRYRIENQDIAEGYHFFLIRATMKNGEVAIERTIIQIDNTKPKVQLIAPAIGGRYNQELLFSGLATDDVELSDVKLVLRKGDKASYEVPGFFQGMYFDVSFWGATLFDVGLGFTAFDDVVKIQLHWGQFTQAQRDAVSSILQQGQTDMRYGGNVFGVKILANIASLPFAYFWGHDWEWLYAAFAVGANFSIFLETASGSPQILSALLGQIEFPRVKFADAKMFSTLSMYTEVSVWFIPSDVAGADIKSVIPQFSLGLRLNLF